MDNAMDKLKEEIDDVGLIKMLSSIEAFHRAELYDYIKDGKDYDDYVDDYWNGSLLIGRVVGNGVDAGVVTRSAYWEDFRLYVICLDTFEKIADAPCDESLLREWTVIKNSLGEHYRKKLDRQADIINEQKMETNDAIDIDKTGNHKNIELLKNYAQYLHEYIMDNYQKGE